VDRRLLVIALILFVNALGAGLILPLLPFFGVAMGAGPLAIGLLIATLPLFATLAGPPLGALSDRLGRRPVLLGSVAGSVVGFLLLAAANTLPMVFLSRVIDGVSAGNTSTARAAIADITSREARVSGLGITFAMESLGLILGPVLGGIFAAYGLTVAAEIAAGIAFVCFVLTLVAFHETRVDRHHAAPTKRDMLAALRAPRTRTLVMVIFAVQLLIMMMWGTLALYANDLFGFGGQQMGYVSAFAASVGILAQVGLLRALVRVASERSIVVVALLMMGLGQVLLAVAREPIVFLAGVGVLAASFNIAMPTAMGLASRLSSESEQGSAMGTMSSAISLASVVGPILAGALFSVSPRGSYLVAVVLALVAAAVARR
jgi:DHA1 family tetracycline resistance protein-like MFS transporter